MSKIVGYQILVGCGAGQTFQVSLSPHPAPLGVEKLISPSFLSDGPYRGPSCCASVTNGRCDGDAQCERKKGQSSRRALGLTGFLWTQFVRLLGGTVALAICQALLNNSVQSVPSPLPSPLFLSRLSSSHTHDSAFRTTLRKAAFSPDTISAITSSPTSIPTLPNLTLSQRTTAVKAFVQGIRHVWYFTIPCAAISFFLVVGFVKHHSLNRGDDEAQRAQAKEWAARHKLSKEERKQQDMEKGVAVASSEKDARGVDGDEQAAEQKREETMAKRIEEEVTK